MTVSAQPAPPRQRNRLGVAALVIELVVITAPVVAWIVVAVVGFVQESNVDDAVNVALLGGLVIFGAMLALLSPLAILGVVLGIVSLFRPNRGKAAGIGAIVLGVLPAIFGSLGLPLLLGEIVPGW